MSAKSAKASTSKLPPPPQLPVYELLPPVTLIPEGVDPSSLPFPEWSDQDINAEKWDVPKVKSPPKGSPSPQETAKFTDPDCIRLPESLSAEIWKRPTEIYSQCKLVIFKDSKTYPDLISNSLHLLHDDFIRNFISGIGILFYLTDNRRSPIEFATATYCPTTDNVPWRPWHHIYSMCKGGKGQKHNPQVNQLGKYVVRLFWLGCWRKIMIDDNLPVAHNFVLLPSLTDLTLTKKMMTTSPSRNKLAVPSKIEVQLWPFLLCKALLKLSNLCETESKTLLDFDIIHCLTGWFPYKIEVIGVNHLDVWEMCSGYTDHYTWVDETAKPGSKGSKTPKSSKSSKSSNVNLDDDTAAGTAFHLLGVCSDMKLFEENLVPDVSPCWNHTFLIDQTRNIPLIKPEPLPDLAAWKQYRWLEWAIKKGIWPEPNPKAIRCIKMVSNFKKRTEHLQFSTPSQESIDIRNNVMMVEKLIANANEKEILAVQQDDGSIWLDFDKLVPYVTNLCLYFKLSRFKNATQITNIAQKEHPKVPASSGKGAKAPVPTGKKLVIWRKELLCSRNEPMYIFCDSIDYKLVVINLAQTGNINCLMDAEDFTLPFSYVLVEDYDWQSSKFGEIVTSLSTFGNKTLLLELKPGRFVLRMWLKSETSYFIHVMSDSEIEVGTLEYVLEYMSHESERLMKLCDDVSSSFGQLVQKLGSPAYQESLKSFYKSYLPKDNLTKKQLLIAHNSFLEEFVKLVCKVSPREQLKERMHSLRVLFLNPNLNYTTPKHVVLVPYKSSSRMEIKNMESATAYDVKENAATILQAAFKRYFVTILIKMQNQKHPYHLILFENLKNIYQDIFSSANRMKVCADLLRNFLFSNADMSSVNQQYPIFKDLNCTIHLKHLLGKIHVTENSWMPINQYLFYCNQMTTIKVCLFSNLKHFMVRVFNNDTNLEITRFTNNALVNKYESNLHGYTVFCYGWVDHEKECKWKLNFASLKIKSGSNVIVPEAHITNSVIKQIYRPNVHNFICRCLLKVKRNVVLSLRLSTTYQEIKLRLRCLNEEGQLFGDISGNSSIILPAVFLPCASTRLSKSQSTVFYEETVTRRTSKHKKHLKSAERFHADKQSKLSVSTDKSTEELKVNETVYLIEGIVLDDTWPLTLPEWEVVDEFKNKALLRSGSTESLSNIYEKSHSGGVTKSIETKSALDITPPLPHWILEVVSNVHDDVVTSIDNRRQEEINDVKRQWYENDVDRYDKSKELREQFLESHYIKIESEEEEEEHEEEEEEEEEIQEETSLVSMSNASQTIKSSEIILENVTRTLIRPPIPSKTLKPFNLDEYILEGSAENSALKQRCVLTPELEETLFQERCKDMESFDDYLNRYNEDMSKLLGDQAGRFRLLNDFYKYCTTESDELRAKAFAIRTKVIEKGIIKVVEVPKDDFF